RIMGSFCPVTLGPRSPSPTRLALLHPPPLLGSPFSITARPGSQGVDDRQGRAQRNGGDGGQPSATTMAEAMPASWEIDRCQVRTPSSAARAATDPRTWTTGAPPTARSTVQ